MANLNLKIVNDIPVSLPTLKEQQLIVAELEGKLTICNNMVETINYRVPLKTPPDLLL